MLDFRRELLFGVSRIQSTFRDDLGNTERGSGTGFWMRLTSGRTCFITCRHNVNPSISFPKRKALKLDAVSLELRLNTGTSVEPVFNTQVSYFEISDGSQLFESMPNEPDSTAPDCAIIVPEFKKPLENYQPHVPFSESDLADEDFFNFKLMPAQDAYFIGFPGLSFSQNPTGKSVVWWDTLWNLPVVRGAIIASFPAHPFTNEHIYVKTKSEDVLLVSGMSFNGSSGSPVIAKERGTRVKPPLQCEDYVPEKLIGIMSGHWWDEKDEPDVFKHSGLSYLTRSTSILGLIRNSKL